MNLPREGWLLRILIGESDRYQGMALHEWIVHEARRLGIAGATVLRGLGGYGATSRLHTARILRLSSDLPIVVEIVDTREAIDRLLAEIEPAIGGGLATLERVEVHWYRGAERVGDP